ncbi:hypothetical protein D047_1252A, partial [Vibrio parahaemolyticus VPTS-2010_2]
MHLSLFHRSREHHKTPDNPVSAN